MKRLAILLFFIFLISGCSTKHPYKVNKKGFYAEDEYIIKALFYENNGNYKQAGEIYKFLYEKTNKKNYFRKYLDSLFELHKYNEVIKEADNFLKKEWDDEVFKIKIFALLEEDKLNEAKEELLSKFNKKDEFFYSMMSYILMKQGNFLEALTYSRSNYSLNPSIQNLINLADVLIKNQKYNEAIAYLNTELNKNGCNYDVCLKLAQIYRSLYDYERLADIYEKLGRYNKKYYLLALNYYMTDGKYKKALNLVMKYKLDEEYLMYIYEQCKKYNKAALVAMNLYIKRKDIKYLYKYTIYIYKANNDLKTAKEVVKKLKFIIKKIKTPFIYNFLGYVLIDKNINPKEGLEYIKIALQKQPDSIEFIDSLAWGYYKINDCKTAWEIIKQIDSDDEIILKHKKMIKRCLYDTSKNNRKNKK